MYKRKGAPPPDVLSRVETTLLEYDFRRGQQSKQVNLEKAGEDGGVDEEELEEKIDEEVYQYTDVALDFDAFFFVCVFYLNALHGSLIFYGFCVYFF